MSVSWLESYYCGQGGFYLKHCGIREDAMFVTLGQTETFQGGFIQDGMNDERNVKVQKQMFGGYKEYH